VLAELVAIDNPYTQAAEKTVNIKSSKKYNAGSTLQQKLDGLGGIKFGDLRDITGETKLSSLRYYRNAFSSNAKHSLRSHIERGDLDEFLPPNLRLESMGVDGDAYDSSEAYDYIADKIKNGTRTLTYEAEQEIIASKHYNSVEDAEKDVQSLTDEEINAELQRASYEQRESNTEATVFDTSNEDSITASGEGTQGRVEPTGQGSTEGTQGSAKQGEIEVNAETSNAVDVNESAKNGTQEPTASKTETVVAENATTQESAKNDTKNTDLLGENTKDKQDIADAERAKDAKRNNGDDNQGGFVLTGSNSEADKAAAMGAQDLFAQPSTQQAIEAIKSDESISKADKIRLASELRQGTITADDVNAVVESKPNQENDEEPQAQASITDFGEKLEGAKKDLWRNYQKAMADTLPTDATEISLSKNFPEPDYENLIASGLDIKSIAAIKAMRDEISTKPKMPSKVRRWVSEFTALREFSNSLINKTNTLENILSIVKSGNVNSKFADRIKLYGDLGYPAFKSAKGYSVSGGWTAYERGVPLAGSQTAIELPNGRREYFKDRATALDALRAKLAIEPEKTEKKVKLDVYRVTKTGEIVIGKKVASNKYIDLKGGFATSKEAFQYYADNEAQLLELLEKRKNFRPERKSVNNPRVGEDYRMGEDITPEKFAAEFGFRGVQFGNYVEQSRRPRDLNNAYDALLDLSHAIGIPPRAISLNGTLGLAFGARGSGGKNPAAAHYESSEVVINLTKVNGFGSLGHEWFHAMDNYLSKSRGKNDSYITGNPRVLKVREGNKIVDDASVRPELLEAFNDVMKVIKASDYFKRSIKRDNTRTNDYWSTDHELAARAFEAYLIAKFKKDGKSNDYLANVEDEEVAKIMDEAAKEFFGTEDPYPYPTRAEQEAINPMFDKLFATLQTKEADNGNVALFSRGSSSVSIQDQLQSIVDGDNTAKGNVLTISENSPASLQMFGFDNLPVVTRTGADGVLKMHYEHGLSVSKLASVIENGLKRPSMILQHKGRGDIESLRFVTNETHNGKPVILAVQPEKESATGKVQLIATAFEIDAGTIDSAIINGNLLYRDTNAPISQDVKNTVTRAQIKYAREPRSLLGILPNSAPSRRQAYKILSQSDIVKFESNNEGLYFKRTQDYDNIFTVTDEYKSKYISAVQSNIDSLTKGWKNAPEIVVVYDMNDDNIREAVRDENERQLSQGATGNPEGFYDDGKVYIVASEMQSKDDIARVVFHEALGHRGLQGVFGKALDGVLDNIYMGRRKEVLAKAEQYGLDFTNKKDRRIASEEVLAELAQTNPQIGYVKRAIAAIRNWLRENVPYFKNMEFTDADIVQAYILSARNFVVNGGNSSNTNSTNMARRLHGDVLNVNDFVIPETPEFADNKDGTLSYTPIEAVAKGIEQLPIKLTIGSADARHRGFGIAHLADNASYENKRNAPDYTDDKAENFARHVAAIARSFDQIYQDGNKLVFRSSRMKEALIIAKKYDAVDGANFYSVISLVPSINPVWGSPEWAGRVSSPASRLVQPRALELVTQQDAPLSRQSLRNHSSKLDIKDLKTSSQAKSEAQQENTASKTNVTFKKRRTFTMNDVVNSDDKTKFSRSTRTGNLDLTRNNAFESTPETFSDKVIRALQDKNLDLKQIQKQIKDNVGDIQERFDAYLQEELYHGRAAKRTKDFIEKELNPLITEMRMRKVEMADFEEYLWMRHAPERNAKMAEINEGNPDGLAGVSTEDAEAYIDNLSVQDKKNYESLAKRIDDMNAGTRNTWLQYGLESVSTVNAMQNEYEYYVPLMRAEMESGSGNGTGQGFSIKGNSTKRATGSRREVVDIIANIAQAREKAIIRGEKNRVSTALIGLAKTSPNDDFWKVNTPPTVKAVNKLTGFVEDYTDPNYKNRDNVIVARIPDKKGNIQERSITFNQFDERAMKIALSMKNLDVDQLDSFTSTVAIGTRWIASVNTQYNPVFGAFNLWRDAQAVMINLGSTPLAGKQKEVLGHTVSALKGIYIDIRDSRNGNTPTSKWAELWEEFQKEGGQTGYRDQFKDARERSKAIEHALNPNWWAETKIGKVLTANGYATLPYQYALDGKYGAKAMFNWLSDYNETLENAMRLSVYKVALDNGQTKQQAASIAKNISVNFNRKGSIGRQAGALFAFFNASVQGTARMAEALTKDGKLSSMGQKVIYGGLLLGAMQAIALSMAGFDDDEPPEFIKDRNIVIPLGDGKYLNWALPLGYNVVPAMGRIATEFMLGGFKDAGEHTSHMIEVIMDMFNPIGNAGMSLQTLTPTVADPLIALTENRDWNGQPIYKEDFNSLDPSAGFTRAKDTASFIAKGLSYAFNYISGGDDDVAGGFSPTPDQIDYLIGQATGGVGREISKLEQTVSAPFGEAELPTYKIPLVGRVYGDAKQSASQGNAYYKNIMEMNRHKRKVEAMRERGDNVSEYLNDYPEAKLLGQMKGAEAQISRLKKQRKILKENGADPEKLKRVNDAITEVMKRINTRIKLIKDSDYETDEAA